jgi:hypothetical protein
MLSFYAVHGGRVSTLLPSIREVIDGDRNSGGDGKIDRDSNNDTAVIVVATTIIFVKAQLINSSNKYENAPLSFIF